MVAPTEPLIRRAGGLRRGGLAAASSAAVLLLTGCAGGIVSSGPAHGESTSRDDLAGEALLTESAPPASLPQPPGTIEPTDVLISAGTAAQRELIREILEGMGRTAIARVVVRRAGEAWRPNENVPLVHVRAQPCSARAYFEASLLFAAFTERSGRLIVGAHGCQGDSALLGGGPPSSPRARLIDAERMALEAERAALDAGATILDRQLLNPSGHAVVLVMQVPEQRLARFLRYDAAAVMAALAEKQHRLDGHYLELRNELGEVVWTTAAFRHGGTLYSRPDLGPCLPVPPARPLTIEPEPTCPV